VKKKKGSESRETTIYTVLKHFKKQGDEIRGPTKNPLGQLLSKVKKIHR